MHEAEGVADLVRGELAGAGENHLQHVFGDGLAFDVGREQRFGDHVILAGAAGAERDLALDDLAGAGIDDGVAVAPAARITMHPLDHVVANVHGVGAFGEDFDDEGVFEAGGLEGLVPPGCAFDQRGSDGLGRAAVHVVNEGLDGLADGGVGVTS